LKDESVFNVVVPRLQGRHISKIRNGLESLIKKELIPLMDNTAPRNNEMSENLFFEEVFYHMTACLQSHIRKKLKCTKKKGGKLPTKEIQNVNSKIKCLLILEAENLN
jgi:hypothetical protein